MIKIVKAGVGYQKECLKAPFGFKGGYVTNLWQTSVFLRSQSGKEGVGPGVQSILWSDADVFSEMGETAGNEAMLAITEFAVSMMEGISFKTPMELLDKIFPEVYLYGKSVTGRDNLKKTFVLNALVPLDLAAWQLYAEEMNVNSFSGILPEAARDAFIYQHSKLAAIPLITYGMSSEEIMQETDKGFFFLKIKIGNDPDKDGDFRKMLEWDKNRLTQIHSLLKDVRTPYTKSGKIPYYLDANGRYKTKEQVLELLKHAEKIGALEQILLLEEPFPEGTKIFVGDLPVRIAADESAHSDEEVKDLIKMGYRAIALKPIAKTLSMTFKICGLASQYKIPCFCADLTVNPYMVEWNKNVAARIAPLPGMKIGVLESNGHQNYQNWEEMKQYCSYPSGYNPDPERGIYTLDNQFYSSSGGILENNQYYRDLAYGEKGRVSDAGKKN